MNVSQLINEIVSEWAYRVEDGMPNVENPTHLKELKSVLSEMGMASISKEFIKNLIEAETGAFKNPILNKVIKYKNTKGEDAEGVVGNLLRLHADHPGRKAAERLLPADGTEERDALNKDLGGEGQPQKPEEPKDKEGGEDKGGGEEEKMKQAQAMFDPKVDPAMAARLDKEKETLAQLANKEKEKEQPKAEEPKKEDEFNPIAAVDVKDEIPQADPDAFGGDSDIPDDIDEKDLEKFNTDISKVKQIVDDAKAKGEKAPNINLCQITVPGTNLYCDDNLGIPREEMPQFKGKPQPGTPAADMPLDKNGEVDTEPLFKKMLGEKGIKVVQTEVPADKLKATQSELVGAKVIGMMGALEENPNNPGITAPIYVSRDGFVIDGHHRWAAIAAYNASHPDAQIPMKVQVIDMDIKDAIPMCNKFAEQQGVAAKKADANKETPTEQPSEPAKREPANDDPESKVEQFKGKSSGENIQTMEMEGGGFVYGTKHGNTAMVDDILDDVKSKIPKERWGDIVFVGEGGATNNAGELEFHDEMDYAAPKFKEIGAEIDTWDGDELDVHNDQSKLYKRQKEKTGFNDSQVKAGNWASMIGQGEGEGLDPNDPENTMKAEDYLDDDGKQFLQNAAKEAGLPPIENFDNPTGEKPSEENDWKGTGDRGTLYRLAFPNDNGDKETKINDIQVAFNEIRDENLIEKSKELAAKGKIPITIAGESHVDLVDKMSRKGEEKPEETPTEKLPEPKEPSTQDGGVVYSLGGGYYSDTPGGPAQYRVVESVVAEVLLEGDETNSYLLFEATVTKKTSRGKTVKLKTIDKSKQKKATAVANAKAKKSKETQTTKKSTTEPKIASTNTLNGALISTAGKNGETFVDKKKNELVKLVDKMTSGGKLNLVTEDGKPISIKKEVLESIIQKVFSGKPLSDKEKIIFNQVFKFVTNPANGDVKIYVAGKIAGRFPQQGYKSIELKKKNIPMGDAVRAYALKNGLNVGKSSEGAIGKKVLTPLKMAASLNPNKPEQIVEIKETKDGVSIAGKEFKRLKELDENNLRQNLIKKGYTPEEAAKKARTLTLQTKAYNQKLDELITTAKKDNGNIRMANFGDVTNPEARRKTTDNLLNGIIKRFTSELEDYGKMFGKKNLPNTPENKKVFDGLNKLKQLNKKYNLETDEKARNQYKELLDQLLVDMANSKDFKDSVADFTEMKAGLQFLAEGKQVYFPASENFQTADIIVMPDEFSVKPKKGQTLEESIAENLQFYAVTVTYVGGLSVKYKGGGGSASYNKILMTVYKNPQTQAKLLKIQGIYSLAYPKDKKNQLNIQQADIDNAKKEIDDTIKWAIKNKLLTEAEAEKIRLIGERQASNTLKGALKDVAQCEGADREAFEGAVVLHHTMMHLTAVLNNRDMEYTIFSNFNEEVSQNKDGVATKVRDDIADGVTKPCYMNPHHNPGFEASDPDENDCVTAAPTNQNPSHIESEPPKNLLK